MYKLTIELVPKTSWFTNLRRILSKKHWDEIRKKCYKNANNRCEICGEKGNKWPVECHEIWEFNDINYKQTLTGLIALCPDCHKVKHIGLSYINGTFDKSINHLIKINNISRQEAITYVESVNHLWETRNTHIWKLDISYINFYLNKEIV